LASWNYIGVEEDLLKATLSTLPLGALRYFACIGSTNEEALRWAESGAPHLSLLVADEQIAGRGRKGRRWFTPPGAALAFSLVLRPGEILRFAQNGISGKADDDADIEVSPLIPRLAGLAALSVCSALESNYALAPQIKWPNDVLLNGCKTCGILPELSWQGDLLQAAILGVGINIAPESVPPPAKLLFPATCLEAELGRVIDRWVLLRQVLSELIAWLPRLATPDFLAAWEDRLAYRGGLVRLEDTGRAEVEGRLLGLDPAGSLRLKLPSGEEVTLQAGELSLRPIVGED
jgi:BirA family biotin operon repressor/biotin-[acetyl-CoA-carboxylase] ligase